jgi:hypothetical protein
MFNESMTMWLDWNSISKVYCQSVCVITIIVRTYHNTNNSICLGTSVQLRIAGSWGGYLACLVGRTLDPFQHAYVMK